MKLQKFLFTAVLLTLVSCGGSGSDDPQEQVKYYPVILEGSRDWSFVDAKGNVYLTDEFDNAPTAVYEDIFSVNEGDGYTVYEFDKKKPKAIKGLEGLKSVGRVTEGLIGIVRQNERITFVDKSGKTKFELKPVDGKEITSATSVFSEGLIVITDEDGKEGYADTKGKVVINPKYDDARPFSEGYAIVSKRGDDYDYTHYIINKKGEEKCKIKSDYTPQSSEFKDGVIVVSKGSGDDRRVGFLDAKGEFKEISKKVKNVSYYDSKFILYTNSEGNFGLMTRKGEELIRAKYDFISMIDDNTFVVVKDDKCSIVNKKDEKKDINLKDYKITIKLPGQGFELLAEDEDNVISLLSYKGKKIGKESFKRIYTDIEKNHTLRSDYDK